MRIGVCMSANAVMSLAFLVLLFFFSFLPVILISIVTPPFLLLSKGVNGPGCAQFTDPFVLVPDKRWEERKTAAALKFFALKFSAV